MIFLAVNLGSSSIKLDLLSMPEGKKLAQLRVEAIGSGRPQFSFNGSAIDLVLDSVIEQDTDKSLTEIELSLRVAVKEIISSLNSNNSIEAIVHRVVHGGEKFSTPILIDSEVEQTIESLFSLAPLHNPLNLLGIKITKELLPQIVNIAVFDTAFHSTLPNRAKHYAIPKVLREDIGIRRFGFHGTNHSYASRQAAKFLGLLPNKLRTVVCHLGNGCSVCAVEYGRSIETSMGYTPLEGLVMGSRSGDIDPGMVLLLLENGDYTIKELSSLLNGESGLKGLSSVSNDMREIIRTAAQGGTGSRLALNVFSHRLRKYIGAYTAVMGGVDCIVFTGGIGENQPQIRHRALQRMGYLGVLLNEDKNIEVSLSAEHNVFEISEEHSPVKVLVVSADEQLAMAQEAYLLQKEKKLKVGTSTTIPIAISARHVHLSKATMEKLFGKDYELTEKCPLKQPGQFAAEETVCLVGPEGKIENVRVLGPLRKESQVEISRTDEFKLGIDAPVRASGHLENTPGITLEGPKGRVSLKKGLICAWRHIHMTPEEAEHFSLNDKDIVEVKVLQGQRSLTFGEVLVRVSQKYKLEMHIDTDEANAAELEAKGEGVLLNVEGKALFQVRNLENLVWRL